MNDYSKYIKSEYGFITNIETNIENKTIEVTTSKTKKGQPHIYDLNKENIQKLYHRLENQYRILIENKDEILENITKETDKKFSWIFKLGFGILILTLATSIICMFTSDLLLLIPQIIGALFGGGLVYCFNSIVTKKEKSLNRIISTYKYYLDNRKEMEQKVREDENILSYIDTKTNDLILENQLLIAKNLTDELFDIQFMDKIPVEQLEEMIERYQISKSLEEEQYFYIEKEPVEEEKSTGKKKIRT